MLWDYRFAVGRPETERTAIVTYAEFGTNHEKNRTCITFALKDVHSYLAALAGEAVFANVVIWLSVAWYRFCGTRADADVAGEVGGDSFEGSGGPARERRREWASPWPGYTSITPSTAVQLAYTNVRSALRMDDARTHWEVYRDVRETLDGGRRAALRSVRGLSRPRRLLLKVWIPSGRVLLLRTLSGI